MKLKQRFATMQVSMIMATVLPCRRTVIPVRHEAHPVPADVVVGTGIAPYAPGIIRHRYRVGLLACLFLCLGAQETDATGDWLTVNAQTLAGISAEHGQFTWTNDHVFNGERALLWSYEAGGTLTVPYRGKPLGYAAHFFLAFHQDAPVPDGRTFTVSFSHGHEAPACTVTFTARRRDWNRVELHSSESYASISHFGVGSATGFINGKVDTVTIRAPAGSAGRIRIGQYALGDKEPVRFENVGVHVHPDDWGIPPSATPTAEDRNAFQTIECRVERELLENPDPGISTEWRPDEVRRRIGKLGIHRAGDGWRGSNVTVDTRNDLGYLSEERDYCRIMGHLAHVYTHASDESIRQELLADFLLLWDFQRYIGGMPDSWAGGDGFMEAAFLMRRQLRESGRLTPDVLAEIKDRLALDRIYTGHSVAMMTFRNRTYRPGELGEDCDYTRMSVPRLLISILLGPDSPEKVRDLRAFSTWLDQVVCQYSPGVCDTFKPDGSLFHHQSFIPGYGSGTLLALSQTIYDLSATSFGVGPRAHGFLRDILMRWRLLLREGTLPLTLGGKGGFVTGYNGQQSTSPFLFMTMAGTPDGRQAVDPLMAGAWLRLLDCQPATPPLSALHQQAMAYCREHALTPETAPSGHWTWPYGALAVHRRDDWLLQVKGHSSYIYAREAGPPGQFPMVTFLGYGTVELLTAMDFTRRDHGRSYHAIDLGKSGFDWSRFPGTTAPILPPERLRWQGWKHHTSDQGFVGGVDGPDGDGIFALVLHGAKEVKLESFRARKSWHSFGRAVLCLGSGIVSGLADDEHGTTLFQEALGRAHEPLILDGSPLAAFPVEERRKQAAWIMDGHGNGYVVPAGQDLVVRRALQSSRDADDKIDTHGDWSTVWLSHGRGPRNATYQYVMLPQARTDEVAAFHQAQVNKPLLRVLCLDATAHIALSVEDRIYSYALFEAAPTLTEGPIRSASRPCLAMVKPTTGGMMLHVSDPDLGLNDTGARKSKDGKVNEDDWGYSRPTQLRLVLTGPWTTDPTPELRITIQGDRTTIDMALKDGATRIFNLKKIK